MTATETPNKSQQPTPVGVLSSADTGHVVVPAWLSLGRGITAMRFTFALFAVLFICFGTGCATSRLTKHQAAEIATQLAKKDGEKMERYQAPRASFDSQTKKWSVF
jgi:hypothetical protein